MLFMEELSLKKYAQREEGIHVDDESVYTEKQLFNVRFTFKYECIKLHFIIFHKNSSCSICNN